MPLAFFVQGALDPDRVEACLRSLIRRHAALRTGFHMAAEDVVQRVEEEVPFSLEVRESAPDPARLAQSFMRPFDLSQPPLLRVCMAKVAEDHTFFLFDTHHIAFDGISGDILIGDLVKLLNGEELPPLAADYRSYVAREEAYLASAECAKHEAYWLANFRPQPPALELPGDRSRGAARTFRGRRIFHAIGREKTAALKKLSQRNGSTLFMLLFAAYFTLLHKLTGAQDVAVGTTFDARMDERYAGVVGMFVNTIAIRTRPAAQKSFKAFLAEVKRAVFEAFDCQDYPFEMIVAKLGGRRELSRNPIFDTMFVYEQIETQRTQRGGLTITKYDLDNQTSIFDLTHEVLEIEGALSVSMEYNSDLFDEATIQRYLTFYDRILDAALADPEQRLDQIDLLDARERRALLEDFNATAAPSARERSVAVLFEDQVRQTPHATAIVCDGRALSYSALNAGANRLAHYLQTQHGVGPNTLVGLMMARSEWMITALLGILKAGGAYVPIDPDYPAERIRHMLADAGCRVLLTDTDTPLPAAQVDTDAPQTLDVRQVREGSPENPTPTAGPDDLCYVIYTSGSTGRPKGCQLEHRNLSHYICWALQYYFEGRDYGSFGLYTSLSFDLTVTSIFCTLLRGRCLTIYDGRSDMLQVLAHNLDPQSAVDCIKITPSHISLLKHLDLAATNVELAIVGGEQLTIQQVRLLRRLNPRMRIVNEYGPTEFTVGCIVREVMPDDAAVLIGKPIVNSRVYILDPQFAPVPVGVVGEICLSGDGLARGYLNRPDLTAQKFVPDPFRPGERMYRSGDLGKWLPDGNIVCLGRSDHQVKLHGFRIEPGEIEALLVRHADIDQAAVLLRADQGDPHLCAWLVCRDTLRIEALRSYLAAELPDYMIPARFVRIEAMPLTPNGKVDTKVLAAAQGEGLAQESAAAAPATANEVLLADIWQAVLGVQKIGVLDNYFALGGDSIKAIQILSRLRQHQLQLDIRHLFEMPTIRALAKKLSVQKRVASQASVSGRAPLSAIQTWFFQAHAGNYDHYTQAVVLRSDARLDEKALQQALRKLQAHHDSLRATFRRAGDTFVQEIAGPRCPLHLAVVDLQEQPDGARELERRCAEVPASLRLDQGPLLKTVLFRLADGDRLLMVIHHLAVDGVSWRILLEDLARGYNQAATGRESVLPPKTDAYRLWSEKIEAYSTSPQLQAELPYWQRLAQADALFIAPDFEAADNCYQDMETLSLELGGEDTTALLTDAQRAYHTEVNDLLLTALGRALRQCHGAGPGLIEIEGHGREALFADVDISRTVGWFTSIYPALIDIPDSDDPGLQIRQIKEGLRRVPHKGIGYGILKYLAPAEVRATLQSGQPARMLFNYLGRFDEDPRDGLRIADLAVGNTIDPAMARGCEIEIEGAVLDGRLKLSLSYNRKIHTRKTVQGFLEAYREALLFLIRHCIAQPDAELTPHDLTYKKFSLPELDRVLAACGMARSGLQDIYPLSPLQEGMLFQHMLDKQSSAYFVQISYGIDGDLDPALFEECWNRLIARHDILRTVFKDKAADRPLQLVARRGRIDFNYADLSALPAAQQAERLAQFKTQDRQQGFDPTAGVPLRISLFKKTSESFAVVWSLHHLLSDGWCAGILMSEFFETYAAMRQGRAPALAPAAPYVDYIRWLERQDRQATIEYWRACLEGYERPAVLPRKAAAQRGAAVDARTLELLIEAPMLDDLKHFAAEQQVTLSTLVQSAWGLLLGHFSGVDDVVFGATVSGRPPQVDGIENMAGLFINTIPVRIRINPEDTMARLVRWVQAEALRGEPHHYGSLADIQAASPLKGQLLDHALVFENYPLAEELIGLERKYALGFGIRDVQVFEQTDYDLTIVVEPGESLQVLFCYNAAALDEALMRQVQAAFGKLLGALAGGAAHTSIADLRLLLLSADEKKERETFMQSVQDISEDF